MASVRIKFKASSVAGKEGRLFYQVIHKRVVRLISTSFKVSAAEWDNRSGKLLAAPCPAGSERQALLQTMQEKLRWDCAKLNHIILFLARKGADYTAEHIVALFRDPGQAFSLFRFMQKLAGQLQDSGKLRTAETYRSALRSFARFRDEKDILMEDIDSNLLMQYECWLKERSITMNTVSFYMRILRAAYNRAVEGGLTTQRTPFKRVYTGVDKTKKRAVPLKYIRRIKDLELGGTPSLDFARDMFLFSFYTRGMSFIDMAYLRKTDLQNGTLVYRRRKTGQQLFIRWETCMQQIASKYAQAGTALLLPILKTPEACPNQYYGALRLMNCKLKRISEMAGLPTVLTTYVARHSWANAAKNKNIPLSVISEGMGHRSEKTTQIYLASLDVTVIDRANRLILNSL